MVNYDLKTIKEKLFKELNLERYIHTEGVAYTACSLAMCHKYNFTDALLAGYLHDCAKCLSAKKLITICEKSNIDISKIELANPSLLHAKAGSIYAKKQYNIVNPEILSSIYYHTTGKPQMTTLEKIIYIADYIEPNRRELTGLNEIREMAFSNLDQTVCAISYKTLEYLKTSNSLIDDMTEQTYKYYYNLLNR